MRDIKTILEGIVSQAKPVGSGGSAFRHSSSSGAKGPEHGIDVGAHRNQAHEVRAKEATLDNAKKREQEVEKRNRKAEQRQKETMKMAKEELQEELHPDYKLVKTGKKSTIAHPDGKPTYDIHHKNKKVATLEPYSAYKDTKIPGKRYVASRKDVTKYAIKSDANGLQFNSRNRYHNNSKDAAEYFVQQHQHSLKEETVTEAKHVFHVHMKNDDTRSHKMVDDKTSEPVGSKPKSSKLVMKVPAADSREARNKVSRHIAKNYGVNAVKSIEYKGLDEEVVTEAKKFVFDKPHPAMVKAYDKRDTSELHGMHKRWSSDHSSPKNNPETSEKLLAVHHVLKSRGESVGELPKHKNLGLTMHEETNTEKRMKIKNVGRPDDAAPTSEKSTLAKTGEIKTKIVEDKPTMSVPNFGLSASLINAARQIVEKKHEDDGADAKKMTGGKTAVDLEPETSDKMEDSDNKPAKKKSHTVPKTDKEKKLAALASPKDKITHKDVLVGRGVVKEDVEFSDEELARIEAIAAQLDEAKPTIVSAPIRGANQDQSGIGTKSSSTDYTISDSKKMKVKEEANLDEARGRPRKNPLPAGQEPEGDDTHKHPMQQLEKIAHSVEGNEPHFEHKDGSKTKVGKNLARHMVVTHNSMKTTQEKNNFADKMHANRDSMRSEMGKHF